MEISERIRAGMAKARAAGYDPAPHSIEASNTSNCSYSPSALGRKTAAPNESCDCAAVMRLID
jgi:hypothetical protein